MKRNSGGEALLKKLKFNKNVIGAIITEDQAKTTLSNIPIQENEKNSTLSLSKSSTSTASVGKLF